MNVSGKKIFLIGFVVVLLVGIPLSVYLLQQQQEVRSRAEVSTNIGFTPSSTEAAPIQKAVGEAIPLDITVDPGKNLVSYVKLEIQYDPDLLATDSANAFQPNTTVFPSVLEGPIYTPGKIAVSLSVGPDPTKAIQQKVTAATVNLIPLKDTPPGAPTLVTFSQSTQVLSLGSNDQASENVLSNADISYIVVSGGAGPTEAIPTGDPTPTIPVPTVDTPTAAPTIALPTDAPTPTTPLITPTGPISSDPGTPNTSPVCSSLVVDRETTGEAPFSITFTANGSDSDGTINKVTFNFGDGQVSDVTDSGGIGTASINVQASHTYQNPGTYQASVVLTDSANGTNTIEATCQQTITVTEAQQQQQPNTGGGDVVQQQPNPTIPPTGPADLALGAGIVAAFLVIGGAFMFFLL